MSELLDIAQSVAVQAGEYALEQRRGQVDVAATKSNELDMVTVVDRDTEALIRSLIAHARPHDTIFGEEGETTSGTSGLTWVIDPIDGTVNFVYGIPQWAVSIAVVEGDPDPLTWNALAGAVCNPNLGELFSATSDAPADLNGREIRVSGQSDFRHALIGTGFAYAHDVRARQGDRIAELLTRVRDVRRAGSASLDLCAVAAGRFDGYYEANTSPWDFAAGALIARQAGAEVSGFRSARPDKRMVLAATPGIHAQLSEFACMVDVLR